MCCSRKYPITPPMEGFWFELPYPSGNCRFGPYLSIKRTGFWEPLPHGISKLYKLYTLLRVYFLEPQNGLIIINFLKQVAKLILK